MNDVGLKIRAQEPRLGLKKLRLELKLRVGGGAQHLETEPRALQVPQALSALRLAIKKTALREGGAEFTNTINYHLALLGGQVEKEEVKA
jgi:hypothetical protein